jgi:hypothetical protein
MARYPELEDRAGWNVPSGLPRSTLTELLPEIDVARSLMPSLLKSPTLTAAGLRSTG